MDTGLTLDIFVNFNSSWKYKKFFFFFFFSRAKEGQIKERANIINWSFPKKIEYESSGRSDERETFSSFKIVSAKVCEVHIINVIIKERNGESCNITRHTHTRKTYIFFYCSLFHVIHGAVVYFLFRNKSLTHWAQRLYRMCTRIHTMMHCIFAECNSQDWNSIVVGIVATYLSLDKRREGTAKLWSVSG